MTRIGTTEARTGDVLRQVTNVITLVIMITVNALANILPINGQTTAAISDRFPVYFVPAGYVFSIWGLIYVALLAFGVYQALPAQRANPALRRIGYLFAISNLVNSAWIFFWHYELFPLTILAMVTLFLLLIAIYLRVNGAQTPGTTLARWVVQIPFSIYLGWITVALIANMTDVLYYLGWDGWGIGGQTWAVIMLGAATLIAAGMALTRRDVAYLLVILWAFIGIAVKQSDAPLVATAAGVAAGVVALALLASLVLARPHKPLFQARATT